MDKTNTGTRSSEEIRAEIERTRADMHDTVDQLESRLSPGQILDELWGRLRQNGGGGGAGEVVREHPVPLALMGLGVAWLAVEKATRGDSTGTHGYVGSTDRAEGRKGPYRGDEVDSIKFSDRATGIGTMSDGGSSSASEDGAGSGLKDKASALLDSAKDKVGDARDAVSGAKDAVGDAAGNVRERASGGIDRIIHDQPLIAGAITFGLGLAAGLAVPSTRFENERLGGKADELKASAREAASEVGEKAMQVASETADAVKDAAREMKDVVNDPELKDALVTKARSVADVAKGVVEETAQRAGGSSTNDTGSEVRG